MPREAESGQSGSIVQSIPTRHYLLAIMVNKRCSAEGCSRWAMNGGVCPGHVPREEYVVTTDVTTSRNKGVCVTLMEHVRRHALTRGVQRGLRIITCVLSMVRSSLRVTKKYLLLHITHL